MGPHGLIRFSVQFFPKMNTDSSPRELFRQTRILFLAMLAGMMLFLGVTLFLLYAEDGPLNYSHEGSGSTLELLLPAFFLFASFAGGLILYKNRIEGMKRKESTLTEKVTAYRNASILRWALMEGAILLCIVLALVGFGKLLLLVAALGLGVFLTARPDPKAFAREFRLSEEELRQLQS